MSRHLRLLMIEDSEDDAALLVRELGHGGFELEARRVDNRADLESALDADWDLILCDYRMPDLDAPTALAMIRGRQIDTPCIIVSGTVGEEHAVAALRSGAQDFVLKDTLARLVPAVERELRDSETRIRHARTESALRETEASFRTAFELIPDGILLHRDGIVLHANRSAASQLGAQDAQDLVGCQLVDLFASSDREAISAREREIDASPRAQVPVAEVTLVGVDGREVHVETTGMCVLFGGQPAILSVIRDVSARRELVARSMQVDRMLAVGTLAAGIGHEINNSLAYVMANLDYATDQLDRTHRQLEERADEEPSAAAWCKTLSEIGGVLGEVADGTRRLRDIARDLNTFARNDEALGPIDLRAAADSALRMATSEVRQRARVIRLYEDVPPVRANASRIGQVFLNLLLNAAHAIGKGALESNEIVVHIRSHDLSVVAEVRDTGSGIAPEHRERLFTPFFTTKPIGEGTGLGLSISRRIVRSFGGDIQAESVPGRGTTMRIILPALKGEQAPQPIPATRAALRRARLLFVDDEGLIGPAVQRALSHEHDVVIVSTANAALTRLNAGEVFDAVFCELEMSTMTGKNFYEVIERSLPQLASRIVLIVGEREQAQARDIAREQVPIIEKPIEMSQLRATLSAILSRADSRLAPSGGSGRA